MKNMETVYKGEVKAAENKSQIPTGTVAGLAKTPTAQPALNRQMSAPTPSYATNMAQSGVGAPSRQFDPKLAMQMLQGRA